MSHKKLKLNYLNFFKLKFNSLFNLKVRQCMKQAAKNY